MSSSSIFLLQALVIVVGPVALLRMSGLKGIMPLVVVQIFVGVILGPSVFGRIAPNYFHMFAGPAVLSPLTGLATLAVLIFGLISGLHLRLETFDANDRSFWAVSAANVAVPMTLGCLAGYWILQRYPAELLPGITPPEFVGAIGICVSMTALPVLAAILGELDLIATRVGRFALGVAGINNLSMWITLSVLLTATAAGQNTEYHGLPPAYLLIVAAAFFFCMLKFVRPMLDAMLTTRLHEDQIHTRAAVVLGAATIASALITDLIGLHYIIGAFLVGAILPDRLHKPVLDRLHVMTVALLMPFFFALTGMRTLIDIDSPALIEIFLVTAGVAGIGIIGGTVATALFFGERLSFGLGLGCLLQAKGLTELIVLTILIDAKIVSPRIFAAMLLVALFSTTIAMPLARLALGRANRRRPAVESLAPGQRV